MAKLLKHLYDKDYIATLADDISKEYQSFKKGKFIDTVFDTNWENKELKQRMRHISSTMGIFLPKDYEKSINILKKVFTKKQTYKKRDENQGIQNMIFQDFVEVYGLNYFDISMEALECFTQNCTSEFAIREFILKYEDKTMDIMTHWAKSKSIHTRRLATEGCRPRLPWATFLPKFQKDPTKIIKILEILKNDDEKYVQKSIANNLNDISKDNPQIAISLAKQWLEKSKSLDYIVKHGCRTLLKARDKETLYLFGYKNIKDLQIVDIKVDKKVTIGDKLYFSFLLKSDKNFGKLRVEYIINYLRLNGKYTKKVFKICENNYNTNSLQITRFCNFRKINTRVYHKGLHKIDFVVNGKVLDTKQFNLF